MKTVKKSADFKKIYAGKSFYTNAFRLHYIFDANSQNSPDFGFTVSKKTISKRAVQRNLVKRRLKEAFRQYFNENAFCGYRFVITAIKSTKAASWQDFVSSVEYSQKRLLGMKSAN